EETAEHSPDLTHAALRCFCRDDERLLRSRAVALPKALRERRLGPAVMVGRRTRASCLGPGSAGQAGEPGRRVPAAVRALHCELCWGEAEDSGQSLNFLNGESSLPAVAAAFGGAHGGVTRP